MEHLFTKTILNILEQFVQENAKTVFELSNLMQYLNYKTRSANRGSKSRSSFANLYALYVLIEDYIQHGYYEKGEYSKYKGADFTPLLNRMRQLPFGGKLQNHALNNRVNDEYHKYFHHDPRRPIIRNVESQKYWINESLLKIENGRETVNIAKAVIEIIDAYVETKRSSFEQFIQDCERITALTDHDEQSAICFVKGLIAPRKDARIFEIVSYAILKQYYANQVIFIGFSRENIQENVLKLYKTGRTNANDGGIDFVMRPLGRFFQVTETLDVKKYFLDIDKIERYPISFVIKTEMPRDEILRHLREGAISQYVIENIVNAYMNAIEEVINIPILLTMFDKVIKQGRLHQVLDEIIQWSKVEFNYATEEKIHHEN